MSQNDIPVSYHSEAGGSSAAIVAPLFPLPNVVLLPRAVVPLHVFEERYKTMTRDVLAGDGRIAMALLEPGWEKCYHGRPKIDSVVCMGQILSHERLADGRYNFLLRGVTRARVVREISSATHPESSEFPYRIATLQPLEDRCTNADAALRDRKVLLALFTEAPIGHTPLGRKFAELVSSNVSSSDLADLVAFSFIEDAATKQALLRETDVVIRLQILVKLLTPSPPPTITPVSHRFSRPSMN